MKYKYKFSQQIPYVMYFLFLFAKNVSKTCNFKNSFSNLHKISILFISLTPSKSGTKLRQNINYKVEFDTISVTMTKTGVHAN